MTMTTLKPNAPQQEAPSSQEWLPIQGDGQVISHLESPGAYVGYLPADSLKMVTIPLQADLPVCISAHTTEPADLDLYVYQHEIMIAYDNAEGSRPCCVVTPVAAGEHWIKLVNNAPWPIHYVLCIAQPTPDEPVPASSCDPAHIRACPTRQAQNPLPPFPELAACGRSNVPGRRDAPAGRRHAVKTTV